MDCDKFDTVLMELLYAELDDLTRAAAQRHADQCQRCRETLAGMRAIREVAKVPLAELPEGFESRVLEAERTARRDLPVRARVTRALTILSGYAMRPQLAMAALLLLVIGTSLALLRPKPGSHGSVQVTEHGAPEAEKDLVVPIENAEEEVAALPPPVAEMAAAAPGKASGPAEAAGLKAGSASEGSLALGDSVSGGAARDPAGNTADDADDRARAEAEDRAYSEAMSAYRAGNHEQAQQQFDGIVQSGGRNAAAAELYAALATEQAAGCAAALPRFDSVAAKNGGSDLGHQATWQSATCRTGIDQQARARLDLEKLLQVPAYAARARDALERLGAETNSALASRRMEKKSDAAEADQEAPAQNAGPESNAGSGSQNAGSGPVAQRAPSPAPAAAKRAARPAPPAAAEPPAKAKAKPTAPPPAMK
jgi:hypothetical protein